MPSRAIRMTALGLIGVMNAGAQRSWSGIGWVESEAGDVITVNPGEMHDGAPIGGARGWQMLYPGPGLVACELAEKGEDRPEIVRTTLRDPLLASLFGRRSRSQSLRQAIAMTRPRREHRRAWLRLSGTA